MGKKKGGKRKKGEESTYPLIQLQDSRVKVKKKEERRKEGRNKQRNIKTDSKATKHFNTTEVVQQRAKQHTYKR